MAVVLAVRGSLTARYSTGEPKGFGSTTTVTASADAGALSGSLVDLTANTAKSLQFSGCGNAGESRAFSVLWRIKNNYSAFANIRVFLQMGNGKGSIGPYLEFWHANATGQITLFGNNEVNGRVFNSSTFGVWTPVSGTYYDLFFTWDGTTAANSAKFYVDGTLLGSVTAGAAFNASWMSCYLNPINLGTGSDVAISNYYLDEFVIWDTQENPASVTLESGTGSLNGASRVSLVAATASTPHNDRSYTFVG